MSCPRRFLTCSSVTLGEHERPARMTSVGGHPGTYLVFSIRRPMGLQQSAQITMTSLPRVPDTRMTDNLAARPGETSPLVVIGLLLLLGMALMAAFRRDEDRLEIRPGAPHRSAHSSSRDLTGSYRYSDQK